MKIKNSTILLFFTTALSLPFLLSCESTEDNKMAGAQECLDKLRDSDPDASAQACEDKISGITSEESYVIRCSVRFFLGGVKSSDLVAAFDTYEQAAENEKAAVLMDLLAQTDNVKAQATYDACVKSRVPSLEYIAASSLAGTLITTGGGDTGNALTNLQNCENGGLGGVCDDNLIGTVVVSLYGTYCVGDAASQQVCTEIRSAMDTSNVPADIAIALYNLMAN